MGHRRLTMQERVFDMEREFQGEQRSICRAGREESHSGQEDQSPKVTEERDGR